MPRNNEDFHSSRESSAGGYLTGADGRPLGAVYKNKLDKVRGIELAESVEDQDKNRD